MCARRPVLFLVLSIAVSLAVAAGGVLPGGAASVQPAAKRALNLDDLAKVRTVGSPQVSPDGRWVAYTVGTIDVEKDRRDSDLWMASWDGTQRIRLTFLPDSGESAPRWSPDGRYLAFLATRGDEEQKKKGAQVWILNRQGGEAEPLTDIKGGVSDCQWSPDGSRLVLVVSDPDPDDEPEKKEGWKRKTTPPVVVDRYHFKADREGYLGAERDHLYLFDMATRTAEQITSGPYSERTPSWSPDGKWIAFVSNRAPDPDRVEDDNVWVTEPRRGAEIRQLTTYHGNDSGRPAWSPDGQWIAYLQGDETKFYAYELAKLAVVPAAGGAARLLTAAIDRPVSEPIVWSADGKALAFTVEDDRAQYLGRVAAAGGAVERLTSGRRVVASPSAHPGGGFAVLHATADRLSEVYAFENGALRALTHENDAWLDTVQLATTDEFTSTSKDGTEVHGLVLRPASVAAGQKAPALLSIHGGPNGQDDHSFDFQAQWLAANGYVVLLVNYRGSSGRGAAFQKAIFADWGNKEVVDLVGAVDWAVAQGIADPDRLGLGGWSYGGILTNYTIATDPRFKAAVSGAGSALQLSMYGTDQYISQYEHELGPPWKSQDLWLKISWPIFKADRIKTPTLFLCGEKDFNVPIAGAEQMYQSLRSLGLDTQLIVYPGQFHGITTPSYARDRLERYAAWFNTYLKPAR